MHTKLSTGLSPALKADNVRPMNPAAVPNLKIHHLHMVSDATGETIKGLTRAALAQFSKAIVKKHHWFMIRTEAQLAQAIAGIRDNPGLVFSTFADKTLMHQLDAVCADMNIKNVGLMDVAISSLSDWLQLPIESAPGKQHVMDEAYFRRIEAMDFTLDHDDGQRGGNLYDADVVLVGVSRTSKTPTSIYLANRGIKTANIPLVPGIEPPPELYDLKNTLVVGLTTDPAHLSNIRRSRVKHLADRAVENYTDAEAIRAEIQQARRLFASRGWPVVDVTRRSIEETAAEVITLLERRLEAQGGEVIDL